MIIPEAQDAVAAGPEQRRTWHVLHTIAAAGAATIKVRFKLNEPPSPAAAAIGAGLAALKPFSLVAQILPP